MTKKDLILFLFLLHNTLIPILSSPDVTPSPTPVLTDSPSLEPEADQQAKIQPTFSADQEEVLKKIFFENQQIIGNLCNILNALSRMIYENHIPALKNSPSATKMSILATIQKLISQLIKTTQCEFHPDIVSYLLRITAGLTHHITIILKNGCKEFPSFDFQKIPFETPKRGKSVQEDLVFLLSLSKKNQKAIEIIESQADNVTLTKINKAFRFVDHWILQPAFRWRVPERAWLGGISLVVFLTILQRTHAFKILDTRLGNIGTYLENKFGKYYSAHTLELVEANQLEKQMLQEEMRKDKGDSK